MRNISLYVWPSFAVSGRRRCFSATPFGIKVERILRFKGIPFAAREIGWNEPSRLSSVSRSGKLPVLDYDGEKIEDSTQIAYLLEDRHPEPRLVPENPYDRARVHFMEEWSDEVLYRYRQYGELRLTDGSLTAAAYYANLEEETRRQLAEKRRAGLTTALHHQGFGRYPEAKFHAEFRASLDGLVALIERDGFLAGVRFTLADIAVFAHLHRSLAGTDPWYEAEVAARPSLGEWVSRIDGITGGVPA
jgi:glutathione S-transferase